MIDNLPRNAVLIGRLLDEVLTHASGLPVCLLNAIYELHHTEGVLYFSSWAGEGGRGGKLWQQDGGQVGWWAAWQSTQSAAHYRVL